MQDTGLREKFVGQLCHPFRDHVHPLTARAELPMPEGDDVTAERKQCRAVGWHGVVGEVSGDDLREPSADFGNWHMPPFSQRLLDLPKLRAHAVAP
jgi:hypothetical protein